MVVSYVIYPLCIAQYYIALEPQEAEEVVTE